MLLQLEEDKIKAEKEDAARKEEERKENERKAEMLRQMQEDLETLKDAAPVEIPEPDNVDTAPTLTTGEATLDKAATPLTTGAPAVDKAPALTTDYPPEKRRSRVVELNDQLELIKVSFLAAEVSDHSVKSVTIVSVNCYKNKSKRIGVRGADSV